MGSGSPPLPELFPTSERSPARFPLQGRILAVKAIVTMILGLPSMELPSVILGLPGVELPSMSPSMGPSMSPRNSEDVTRKR